MAILTGARCGGTPGLSTTLIKNNGSVGRAAIALWIVCASGPDPCGQHGSGDPEAPMYQARSTQPNVAPAIAVPLARVPSAETCWWRDSAHSHEVWIKGRLAGEFGSRAPPRSRWLRGCTGGCWERVPSPLTSPMKAAPEPWQASELPIFALVSPGPGRFYRPDQARVVDARGAVRLPRGGTAVTAEGKLVAVARLPPPSRWPPPGRAPDWWLS